MAVINGDGTDEALDGSAADDTINGMGGDDTIRSFGGADEIHGGDGNDLIDAVLPGPAFWNFGGPLLVFGDAGDDVIGGSSSGDILNGGADEDYIHGLAGADSISGDSGDDTLRGGDGDDTLVGGDGADSLSGDDIVAGDDSLLGGTGDDTLNGFGGKDTLDGEDGDDTLHGGDGDDSMLGGAGADTLFGSSGSDSLDGGAGMDSLLGGDDNDSIIGGDGIDELFGGSGADTLKGSEGSDSQYGNTGNDLLEGGLGDDELFGSEDNDTLLGEGGNDSLYGGSENDSLLGGAGDDDLFGEGGNDTLIADSGFDELFGGLGDDTYIIRSMSFRIQDDGGTDTVIIEEDFVKVPYDVDATPTYAAGVMALPYWLDALLADDANSYKSLLGGTTFSYGYPTTAPGYLVDAADLDMWTAYNAAQKIFTNAVLSYITTILNLSFSLTTTYDAPNVLSFQNNEQSSSAGFAYFPNSGSRGSDVFLDLTSAGNLAPTDGTFSALTLIHEIGHAEGLKHPFEGLKTLSAAEDKTEFTVMSYTSTSAEYHAVFQVLDIAALHYIYGPPATLNAGDTTHVISEASHNFIADGAGTDTIDATGASAGVTIHLSPGYHDFVGTADALITADSQITVNFGTVIENFEGSGFADTVVGNSVANHIETHEGNDTLTGGGGNDTLDGCGGTDDVVYSGPRANYTIVDIGGGSFTITDNVGSDGIDTVIDVENAVFSDETVVLGTDTTPPTIAITTDDSELNAGDTATITFTLSEPSTDFVEADVTVSGGTLSAFAGAGTVYTATFTPNASSTTDGVVHVASGKFNDAAANANADGAEANNTVTMTVETIRPTIAITSDDSDLNAGDTATITFTLSEPATDFVEADVTVTGGTLSAFAGAGSVYTATFTPAADSTTDGVVHVANTKFTDAFGNANADGAEANNTVTMDVDTTRPTIAITSDDSDLNAGDTATVTFTLSEASTDFVEADVTVTGGTLSNFAGAGANYTATFTPDADSTADGVVHVASTKFTDAAANANADGADANNTVTMNVDTIRPTIAITTDDSDLTVGETATITFTLSETATDFVEGDVTVSGGTLSNFAGAGTVYTATFTPNANSTTDGVVSVASTKFSDAADNDNADGADADNTVTMTVDTNAVDTTPPTIAITTNDNDLNVGDSATITFTLSEAATDFVEADVTVTGGTLSNFAGAGANYTATFTPDADSTTDGVVHVASAKFTDAAANANADGGDANNTVTMNVDTIRPTIAITSDDNDLNVGDTATITFTLSEPATDFVEADVTVTGGTLSNFAGAGANYTATFTPDADSTTDGVVHVASTKFTDAAANANADGADANNTVTMDVDTIRPTIVVSTDDGNLNAGDTATITFTLSEPATDFVQGDVTVSGGTLSNFAGAGSVYTATFTPDANSTTDGVVHVASTKFTDAAANANADGADANNTVTMDVDTLRPTIAITTDDDSLTMGETATITFTLSEVATDFVQGDVVVSGGTLSAFAGAGTNYTATFTPDADSTIDGVVSVASTTFTDAAANANADGADANNMVIMDVNTTENIEGTVADGYVSGAKIYDDANNDGIPDPGEDTGVTTDANGDFTLPGNQSTGPVLAVGGTNIDTGLPNDLILSAPQGSTVINPITSLIQEVIYAEGGTAADAETKIQTALGIEGDVDLNEYDPLAVDPVDDEAVNIQSIAAQIAVLATLIGGSDVFADIVSFILANPATVIDLSDSSQLQLILPGADEDVITHAATINQVLEQADSFDDISDTQEDGLDDDNDAPVVNATVAEQIAYEDEAFNFQVPPDTFLDLDAGDSLTYTATLDDDSPLPDWLAFDPQTQTFSGTPDNADIDRLAVKVTATDESDASVATSFTLITVMSSTVIEDLDGTNGFRLDGVAANDRAGWSVSGAGDFNGDGFDDLLVGAFRAEPNGDDSGTAYLLFGKADGFDAISSFGDLDGANGFRLDGLAEDDRNGYSVSGAGDVNGDGFDDLIIGALDADPGGRVDAGSSYVIFGNAGGFTANFDLATLDGSNGFRLDGDLAGDALGGSVSAAGDVNGDGFDDVIVGATDADYNGNSAGASYVVFGGNSGFAATIDLGDLDGTDGFRVEGAATFDRFGVSVSGAGDINNDGFDDVVAGGWGVDNAGDNSGSAYVVFGKEDGFAATVEVSTLDGTNGFRLDGENDGDFAGYAVSSAGDVNDDGIDDLLIGAYNSDNNGVDSGSSYVLFGKDDGFSAIVDLGALDGSDGFRLDGVATDNESGQTVSGVGDVNGDGIDDLLIGAWRTGVNGNLTGSAYLVYGSSEAFAATVELSVLDGTDGFRLDGETAGDIFGYHVSGAGDVNNDGVNDFIIGAPSTDVGGNNSGSSYVVFGQSGILVEGGPGDDTLEGAEGNDTLLGNDGRDTMQGFAGNDEIDGGDDLDHALYQNNFGDYSIDNNAGELTVTGPQNDGEDTVINTERLHFADKSLAFDLDDRAGTIAKLLGAALGKDNWYNLEYIGIGLDLLDNSVISFETLMDLAIDVVIGPNATNEQVVSLLYTNLIGQAPSQAELAALTAQYLDSGALTQAELGVAAANTDFNLDNIDLVGITNSGLEYLAIG